MLQVAERELAKPLGLGFGEQPVEDGPPPPLSEATEIDGRYWPPSGCDSRRGDNFKVSTE